MVDTETAGSFDGLPSFTPIESLSVPNQTLNLIFVTFSGIYTNTSGDLWIPAHQKTTFGTKLGANGFTQTVYGPDNPISVLACTEQHQFCNPNRGPSDVRCTPMLPLGVLIDSWTTESFGYFDPVFDNYNQRATLGAIAYGAQEAQLAILAPSFNTPPLLADDLRDGILSLGIPDDQWIQESDHIFAMSMNTVQRWATEFVTGPPAPYSQYTATAGYSMIDSSTEWICKNQIIRDARYTSFSILWISLIFGLGGLIILVSLNLETVVSYFQRRYRRGLYQQVRWQLDSTLQLQRMAFEEAGFGEWEGGANEIPTTVVKNQQIQVSKFSILKSSGII